MGCFGIAGRSSNTKRITHAQNENHNGNERKRGDRTRKSTQGKVNPCQDVKQEIVASNEEPKAVSPSADLKDDLSETSEPEGGKAQAFKFHELAVATNNFDPSCYLGEGGFGKVHKGHLKKLNQVVAVKQLDPEGVQGVREFLVEILTLNLADHPNLVKLIGYCAEGGSRLVVYEYMPLGSLERHLHDLPPNRKGLTWNARMKIAAGAARGLEYLHCKMNPPVIYRDLKCSNILLDEGYHPKLSDFGLAKVGPTGDKTHVTTRVMGTYGYCAPDYVMTGQLTFKSDIYSFGVVLLELITGRKVIDQKRPPKEQNLVAWAKPLFKDRKKFMLMADPLLEGRYPVKSFFQTVAIAAMCLQDKPNMRPAISEVVTALDFLANQKYPQLPHSVTIHNNTTEKQRKPIVPQKDENVTREKNEVQSILVPLQPNA